MSRHYDARAGVRWLAAATASFVACAPTSDGGDERAAVARAAIVGGADDIAVDFRSLSQARRDAVVVLGAGCSGVLVTPRLVLTAYHCLERGALPTSVAFGPDFVADEGVPVLDDDGGIVDVIYPSRPPGYPTEVSVSVAGCVAHPAAVDGSGSRCLAGELDNREHDLALLILSERVDVSPEGRHRTSNFPARPAGIATSDDDLRLQPVRLAGFGLISSDAAGVDPQFRQFRDTRFHDVGDFLDTESTFMRSGDSGAPYYRGDPDVADVSVVGIHTSRRSTPTDTEGRAVNLATTSNRRWLAGFVSGVPALRTPGLWLGAADRAPVPERPPAADLDMDADGDGLDEGLATTPLLHDNCPMISNPEQRDADGDGLGDDGGFGAGPTTRDDPAPLCPGCVSVLPYPDAVADGPIVPLRASCPGSSALEVDCTTGDRDDDGVPDPCDNCVDTSNPDQRDCSGDGVGDACTLDDDGDGRPNDCDNCAIANFDQRDCDRDGIGDACVCGRAGVTGPCEVSNDDGDGIPNDCDNCDDVANPDQQNCNLDMDVTLSGASHVLGDACDPNPCQRTQDETLTAIGVTAVSVSNTRIRGLAVTGDSAAEGTYQTTFRYCPCDISTADDPSTRAACQAAANCALGVAEDLDAGGHSWSRPTLSYRGGAPTSTPFMVRSYRAPPVVEGARADDLTADWSFELDGGDALIDFGVGRELSVVLWSRAVAPADPVTEVDGVAPFGCNTTPGGCPDLAGDLNSHYWSGRVRRINARVPFDPLPVLAPALFDSVGCPECEAAFPNPFYVVPSCPVELCDPDVFVRFAGAELSIGDRLTPQLRAAMASADVRWIAPQEAPERLLGSDPRLIGLDRSTGAPRFVVMPSFGRLHVFSPGKLPFVLPPGDPTIVRAGIEVAPDDPVETARLAARAASLGRPEGNGFSVFRASTRILYQMGGADERGQPADTVRAIDVSSLDSHEIRLRGQRPGHIVAAALDPTEPGALVLERRQHGFRDHRLFWVDLESGRTRLLASFPSRPSVFDRHDLVALPDGRFGLIASSTFSDRFVVVLLRVTPRGVTAVGVGLGTGRLAGMPIASDRGLSLAVQAGSAQWEPQGLAYHAIRSASLRDLTGCF